MPNKGVAIYWRGVGGSRCWDIWRQARADDGDMQIEIFSGYLTFGSRHYHLRWTLQDLKWIFNNQRCQVVASSKQFWKEQRRREGVILSKMHRWRFAIFGCNFRPRILHWVLAAFLSPLANQDDVHGWVHVKMRRLLVKALAQSSIDFFQIWVPASAIQVMHTATYVMQWLWFTFFGCNLIGDCTQCVSPLLFFGHVFVYYIKSMSLSRSSIPIVKYLLY